MKINLDSKIVDLDGKTIPTDGTSPGYLTLKNVFVLSLMANYSDEQNLPGETKLQRYRLALASNRGKTQDFSVEDVAEIKKLISKSFGALVVGRAYELIESPTKTKTEES